MTAADDMSGRAEWIEVATFSTGLEADIARDTLEGADIPVLVRSNAPGIFGLAFQGVVVGGIALHVPTPEFERARELLDTPPERHLSLDDEQGRP
ncbi:putative signal transducing protein [Gemmatimonas sp.]|uniref:putative signal transducing protein n=1 Tax=Gemmatimonas sp. TaxID=1962908 RepID=UPI003562FF0E